MQTQTAVTGSGTPILAPYLTREQLAEELHVTVRTVARWHSLRTGPPSIVMGGRRLYKRADVSTWLDSLETDAAA